MSRRIRGEDVRFIIDGAGVTALPRREPWRADHVSDAMLYGYTARLSSRAASEARQRLAVEALGALHGPPPENVHRRAWKAAEDYMRASRPKATRVYTEDGELLWSRDAGEDAFARVFMGEIEGLPGGTRMFPTFNNTERAEGVYRCLECGAVVEGPKLGSFGPPSCEDDGGAMVKV